MKKIPCVGVYKSCASLTSSHLFAHGLTCAELFLGQIKKYSIKPL